MRFSWCLHTCLMTLQASNCTNQSLLKMPWPFPRHFLNSLSGSSRGSRSCVSMYCILLDYVNKAGSSLFWSPIRLLPLKLGRIPAEFSSLPWNCCWLFCRSLLCENDLFASSSWSSSFWFRFWLKPYGTFG